MDDKNANPYSSLGKTLLGLLERNGTPISDDLQSAAENILGELYRMESKGGLCVELEKSLDRQAEISLLESVGLIAEGSNDMADHPLAYKGKITPLILDESAGDKLRVYTRRNFTAESRLASCLCSLYRQKASEPEKLAAAFHELEEAILQARKQQEAQNRAMTAPFELNPLQKKAAEMALSQQFSVICGGPGTGKTTAVVQYLEAFLRTRENAQVVLCAPTGKAQSRLLTSVKSQAETSDEGKSFFPSVSRALAEKRISSMTIHKLLSTPLADNRRPAKDHPIDADLIIVDESSMIDASLALDLMSVIDPKRTQAVFLGDKRQLAAVGPGSVFADMSDSRGALKDHVVELKDSIRFNKNSAIGRLAQGILALEGNEPPTDEEFLALFETRDETPDNKFGATGIFLKGRSDRLSRNAENWLKSHLTPYIHAVAELKDSLRNYRGEHPSLADLPESIRESLENAWRVLSTFRPLCAQRKGPSGVDAVNEFAENFVKKHFDVPSYENMYTGKVIIVRKNDPALGVSNGDVAIIFGVQKLDEEAPAWYAYIGDLKRVVPAQLLPRCDSAFAMTIHQSQGSDFDNVAIFLPTIASKASEGESDAENLCTRELLYTGITRAKKSCQVFGSRRALSMSLQRVTQRSGGLPERLKERFEALGVQK